MDGEWKGEIKRQKHNQFTDMKAATKEKSLLIRCKRKISIFWLR